MTAEERKALHRELMEVLVISRDSGDKWGRFDRKSFDEIRKAKEGRDILARYAFGEDSNAYRLADTLFACFDINQKRLEKNPEPPKVEEAPAVPVVQEQQKAKRKLRVEGGFPQPAE